jgi:DNA polymerase-3 subunit delta'
MYFRDVIGLHDVKEHLINSVRKGLFSCPYLLRTGRSGKLPLAIAYARYLNCSNRGAEDACCECPSCHKFDKLAHPDLTLYFP